MLVRRRFTVERIQIYEGDVGDLLDSTLSFGEPRRGEHLDSEADRHISDNWRLVSDSSYPIDDDRWSATVIEA